MQFGLELLVDVVGQADSQVFGNLGIEFGLKFSVKLFVQFRAQLFVQFRLDLCFQLVKVDGVVFQDYFVEGACRVMQIAVQPVQPVCDVISRISRYGYRCLGVWRNDIVVYGLGYFVGQLDERACPALSIITL